MAQATFQILSYLKKHGTGQGMHRAIKSMQDSGSSNKALKRLSEKTVFQEPPIQREGNDYRYAQWQFKIVDDNNKPVDTERAHKIEKMLGKVWEEMLDGNL